MIRIIEALNFRCLRYVRQPLGSFQVLVGPNASGKTTLFDALAFLSQLVDEGVEAAVGERTDNFHDLVWGREGSRFELAIEAAIPVQFQTPLDSPDYNLIRYQVALGLVEDTNQFGILQEALLLGEERLDDEAQAEGVPRLPETLFRSGRRSRWRALLHTVAKHKYGLVPEEPEKGQGDYWLDGRLDRTRTVFRQLNEGEFPASTWLEALLKRNVRRVELSSDALRRPSPPGKGVQLSEDGANLPWAIATLKRRDPQRFKAWLAHVRTAFPGSDTIRVVERPEDKHRYLVLRHEGGLEVPSWMLSDGTLRLLALTVLAYLPDNEVVYLVEEPETSLHPLSIESVLQSLGSVYDGQVLVATQSPSVIAASQLDKILVFSRDAQIGTRIERGDRHPALRDWKGLPNLDVLFASGVLG
jgi:predicted ATPase